MMTSENTGRPPGTEAIAEFLDYSADILKNLQKMAEGNHLMRYAHLLSLAVIEAKFLEEQLKTTGNAAVISIDEKRPRPRPLE